MARITGHSQAMKGPRQARDRRNQSFDDALFRRILSKFVSIKRNGTEKTAMVVKNTPNPM